MNNLVKLLERARSTERIRSRELIELIFSDVDWAPTPDPALLVAYARLGDERVLVLGQQKPTSAEAQDVAAVNFGMMRAVGYWHVVEQLEAAAVERLPIVTLIDTPGADPSRGGVENLIAWAVSASLSAMIRYPGPSVSVIVGEAGSGGALALQIADERLMVSDAIFPAITPESCSAILFRDTRHISQAMQILKPTAEHMLRAGVIDSVVAWEDNIASSAHAGAAKILQQALVEALHRAKLEPQERRARARIDKCLRVGRLHDRAHPAKAKQVLLKAMPPVVRKAVSADEEDHSLTLLRRAYLGEKQEHSEKKSSSNLLCPPDGGGCGAVFTEAHYASASWSCPSCGRGERLSAEQWLALLCDSGSFEELYGDLDLADLEDDAYDDRAYRKQREAVRRQSQTKESLRVGTATINGTACALAVSDFSFMAGTLGAASGEKLRRIADLARTERMPLVDVVCSGGVRMQDGTLGLAQMAKANASMVRLLEAGLPHIVYMVDPCTGGAIASYATCASTILAEPRALLAFAGPRVMDLAGLPADISELVSELYARHGGIDEIVPRKQLRQRLSRYVNASTEDAQGADESPANIRRSPTEARKVSAWFAELANQLVGVLDGARGIAAPNKPTELIQTSVVIQLAELAQTRIPALLAQAANSENARIRAHAVAALARLPQADVRVLEQALADVNHRVRAEAALGLLKRDNGDETAIRVVRELLNDEYAAARRHGLYVVMAAPQPALAENVAKTAADPDSSVRMAAAMALISLGTVDRGLLLLDEVSKESNTAGNWRVRQLARMMPAEGAAVVEKHLEGN